MMDITTNRSAVYASLLDFLQLLTETPLGVGMLFGGCPFRRETIRRVGAASAQAAEAGSGGAAEGGKSGGKRKAGGQDPTAVAAASGAQTAADDEDDRTGIVDVLTKLSRQCKVFIKQCTKSSGGLASVDPSGIAVRIRDVSTKVEAAVKALPMARSGQASVAVVDLDNLVAGGGGGGGGGSGDSGGGVAEDDVYTAEVKGYDENLRPLLFRTASIEHASHTYKNEIHSSSGQSAGPDRLRRMAREMSSLSSSLPLQFASSIFVRVDESRPDVLKALIIGPDDTPYANGCFVFDIFIPLQYPQVPPKVNIVTTAGGRVRFNPNLYRGGKVCLSLLGTWQGPGWDSKHSTILQVLLSIQSLILVEQPYFNEPGFETRPESKAACREYNQALQYHTIQTAMLGNLRAGEVPSPFSRRLYAVLAPVLAPCRAIPSSAVHEAADHLRLLSWL
jgi:baculoviral IAP repeat-containing protein 6